jgi:serine/threonine protein kinase
MNEHIPNRYKILQKIGEGVHGVVLKAVDTMENNKIVAIKKVSLRTKFGGWSGELGFFVYLDSLSVSFRHLAKHSTRD